MPSNGLRTVLKIWKKLQWWHLNVAFTLLSVVLPQHGEKKRNARQRTAPCVTYMPIGYTSGGERSSLLRFFSNQQSQRCDMIPLIYNTRTLRWTVESEIARKDRQWITGAGRNKRRRSSSRSVECWLAAVFESDGALAWRAADVATGTTAWQTSVNNVAARTRDAAGEYVEASKLCMRRVYNRVILPSTIDRAISWL